jgi:hypothetical protein
MDLEWLFREGLCERHDPRAAPGPCGFGGEVDRGIDQELGSAAVQR